MTLLKPNFSSFRKIRSRSSTIGNSCLILLFLLSISHRTVGQSTFAASGGTIKNSSGSVDFSLGQIGFIYLRNSFVDVSFGVQQPIIPDTIARVDSLKCGASTLASMVLPVENEPYQNTLRLPYVRGNGNRYDTMRYNSQGVAGLTLLLLPGKLVNGDSVLVFTISGTPSRQGIAGFTIDFGRASCELTLNVSPQGPKVDSLQCSKATIVPARIYTNLDYQGFLNIPYIGGNGKPAPAATFTSEGNTGLTASFTADTLNRNGGSLRLRLQGLTRQVGNVRLPVTLGGKTCVVELKAEEFALVVPNFFSPNGDGANDLWEIPDFQIVYPNGVVIILDRNGRKLVEFNGNFNGWDGTINGKNALSGVYWYIVKTEQDADSVKGNVTLIR